MREVLTKNLGLKVLALFCATFLWFVVINIDDPVRTKTFTGISVEVINGEVVTNKGRTYRTTDGTETVSVTVKAKQSILQKLKQDEIKVIADMKELNSWAGTVPLEVLIERYEGNYDKDGTYTSPKNLQVKIEEEAGKKFPITPVETGTVRDGYVLSSMSVNPEQVTLRGPESAVNAVSKVQAEVNVTGLAGNTTVSSELIFYDKNNNVLDASLLSHNLGQDGVTVDVKINKIKKVTLKFDTSKVTTEAGYYLGDVIYEPNEIEITGDNEVLSEVKQIDVVSDALILEGLTEKTEKTIDITPYLPEGVKLVDENAGAVLVTVNVEQGGVKTMEWLVGSISVRNAPEGLRLTYVDAEEITLRVRGTQDMLDNLSLASEDVYINLADFQTAGEYHVKVEVKLPAGYSLIEDVTIGIELAEE